MPASPRFDAATIRKAAQAAVAERSLRTVAEEIGVSKSGLDSFLKGREPYSKTRVRLAGWYFKQRHGEGVIGRDDVDAAIALLGAYVNSAPTEQGRARRVREVSTRLQEQSE